MLEIRSIRLKGFYIKFNQKDSYTYDISWPDSGRLLVNG